MNAEDRQDALRERFERDVETLKGAGGVVTGADLAAHAEEMFYAAMPTQAEIDEAMRAMYLAESLTELGWLFAARHDDPQFRDAARSTVRALREARAR